MKSGTSFDCKSKDIVVYILDDMNTKNMLENILDITTSNNSRYQIILYANQWRLQSTKCIIHNAYFYFNKGSLDDNKLVRQFIDAVIV